MLNCLTLSFLISQSLCITFTIDVCHLCLILFSHKLVKDTFIIQEVSGMIFLIKSEYKESLWRRADARNVSFFYSLRWPIYVFNSVVDTKLPAEYNEDWLIAILEGHFENVPIQVTWCDTSHVCKVVKSVMSRPEHNNFAPTVGLLPKFTSEKKIIPFWYRPPCRDYELRSEKLNNEGWIIERRRIGFLYSESQVICTPFQTAIKKYIPIICSA